jgi:tRNA G18 (ribose-2'-O)-methylase SpoU
MPIISITNLEDPRLRHYASLTDIALRTSTEQSQGVYIAESAKVISSALEAGHTPLSILMEERWVDRMTTLLGADVMNSTLDIFTGTPEILEKLTGFHVHRGALAAMARPELLDLATVTRGAHRIAVLENIVDHTNVGAIFRSAAALGVNAVLVTPQCADPLYRRSIRVSMGSVFFIPWTRIDPWPQSLSALHELGFTTVALSPDGNSQTIEAFTQESHDLIAFVLGTEGEGLTPASLEQCHRRVHIPMGHGIDSLNVAAASAVVFWAMRARNG